MSDCPSLSSLVLEGIIQYRFTSLSVYELIVPFQFIRRRCFFAVSVETIMNTAPPLPALCVQFTKCVYVTFIEERLSFILTYNPPAFPLDAAQLLNLLLLIEREAFAPRYTHTAPPFPSLSRAPSKIQSVMDSTPSPSFSSVPN